MFSFEAEMIWLIFLIAVIMLKRHLQNMQPFTTCANVVAIKCTSRVLKLLLFKFQLLFFNVGQLFVPIR